MKQTPQDLPNWYRLYLTGPDHTGLDLILEDRDRHMDPLKPTNSPLIKSHLRQSPTLHTHILDNEVFNDAIYGNTIYPINWSVQWYQSMVSFAASFSRTGTPVLPIYQQSPYFCF